MILIFGGAYQGKLAYALERFKAAEDDVYLCDCNDVNMPENRKIVYEIDKWILALVKNDIDVKNAIRQFIDNNQNVIVICNDISCGVVPLDPVLRKWREAMGGALAVLSRASDEVIRLFCAIPTKIK